MSHKALVIENDQSSAKEVANILTSLDHGYDLAGDQEIARQRIEAGGYDYVLLALEIPIRQDCEFPRSQNGINLLEQIRASTHMRHTPVIVIADHDTDEPELAVNVMRKGATNYIKKPFPKIGRTLDEVIKSALAPILIQASNAAKPTGILQPFAGGELAIFQNHIELCGVTILERSGRGYAWEILATLAQQDTQGRFKPFSCRRLAEHLGRRVGENSVIQCIRCLRERIINLLQQEQNLTCGMHDVIMSRDRGYRLHPHITLRQNLPPTEINSPTLFTPPTTAASPLAEAPPLVDENNELTARQQWILAELRSGTKIRRSDVEARFKCSDKTAQRDIGELREQGLIEYIYLPHPGHYRIAKPKNA
ncbi:MAG: response regulator [Phycisphaerales bacterium]|nr:response regulator [Phycisphaerales bacterium]